jgi:hypothetical protein
MTSTKQNTQAVRSIKLESRTNKDIESVMKTNSRNDSIS